MREKIFKENAEHGQIAFYKHSGLGSMFNCHWHEEYELIYCFKNCASLRIESQSYKMYEGDSFIINPGELHSVSSTKGAECGVYAMVIRLNDVLVDFQNKLDEKGLAAKIFETYLNDSNALLLIKSQIYQLLYVLQTQDKSTSRENYLLQNVNMKSVLTYLDDYYSEKVTLESLAKQAKLSKYHFIRSFKAYTGVTPIKYLNQIRITKAIEILKSGNTDMTHTAMQVGFDSISYFIKVFKETCGTTPLKYQKKSRTPK